MKRNKCEKYFRKKYNSTNRYAYPNKHSGILSYNNLDQIIIK